MSTAAIEATEKRGPKPDRRRRHPLRADVRRVLAGRRRRIRREGDAYRAVLDWYEPELLFLAVGVLALSIADAYMTLGLLRLGLASEANPLMAFLLGSGERVFVGVKILVTAVGVVGLVLYAHLPIGGWLTLRRSLYLLLGCYLLLVAHELSIFWRVAHPAGLG